MIKETRVGITYRIFSSPLGENTQNGKLDKSIPNRQPVRDSIPHFIVEDNRISVDILGFTFMVFLALGSQHWQCPGLQYLESMAIVCRNNDVCQGNSPYAHVAKDLCIQKKYNKEI